MRNDIPTPNRWRGDWLKGPECRSIVTERGDTAQMLYQALVAQRSRELASSARSRVRMGGRRKAYWEATVVVGAPRGAGDYTLAHEFGARERYDTNEGDPAFDETEGAHDLSQVLDMLVWVPM